jgi:hypothetical protein
MRLSVAINLKFSFEDVCGHVTEIKSGILFDHHESITMSISILSPACDTPPWAAKVLPVLSSTLQETRRAVRNTFQAPAAQWREAHAVEMIKGAHLEIECEQEVLQVLGFACDIRGIRFKQNIPGIGCMRPASILAKAALPL